MKNISLKHKIIFANILLCIVITAFIVLVNRNDKDYFNSISFVFGIICLLVGGLNLFIGIILAITRAQDWDTAFLISGGILLLLSGISCGSGFLS